MSNDIRARDAQIDHDSGFNCAQSVLMQFSEDFGMPRETAAKLASGFGGGMRMGKTCGALTGALMVLGLAHGFDTAELKLKHNMELLTQDMITDFHNLHGCTDCKDILGIDVTDPEARAKAREMGIFAAKCPLVIDTAVKLVERYLGLNSRVK